MPAAQLTTQTTGMTAACALPRRPQPTIKHNGHLQLPALTPLYPVSLFANSFKQTSQRLTIRVQVKT